MANDPVPERTESQFDLTTFLDGRSFAWGVFEDRFGHVRRRFSVELVGRWQGAAFVLEEVFTYEDHSRETRVGQVAPTGGGKFTATCADCVGTAQGTCDADTIRMSYRFRLKFNGRVIDVDFCDRFYRIDDDIAVNLATMRKWGVKLGEVSLFFRREDVKARSEVIQPDV